MTDEKRLLTREEAAAYCGISMSTFSNWVIKGTMPKSVAGSRRWDKRAIDAKLDQIAGLANTKKNDENEDAEMEREFYANLAARYKTADGPTQFIPSKDGRTALARARAVLSGNRPESARSKRKP